MLSNTKVKSLFNKLATLLGTLKLPIYLKSHFSLCLAVTSSGYLAGTFTFWVDFYFGCLWGLVVMTAIKRIILYKMLDICMDPIIPPNTSVPKHDFKYQYLIYHFQSKEI